MQALGAELAAAGAYWFGLTRAAAPPPTNGHADVLTVDGASASPGCRPSLAEGQGTGGAAAEPDALGAALRGGGAPAPSAAALSERQEPEQAAAAPPVPAVLRGRATAPESTLAAWLASGVSANDLRRAAGRLRQRLIGAPLKTASAQRACYDTVV